MAYVLEAVDSDEYFHDTDYELLGNSDLYAVTNGCAVTYDAADMTIDIAVGNILHSGEPLAIAAAANALTLVADSSNERWSYITLNSSGTAVLVSGDAAPNGTTEPTKPELGDRVLLEMVKIQAGQTIANNCEQKLDKRFMKRLFAAPKGTDIASASTINWPANGGQYFDITGTTTITALEERESGCVVILQFDGALTLTHNATSLILRDGLNATTAAGDVYIFVSEGSGNWREVHRARALNAGLALIASDQTERTTTSTSDDQDLSTVTGLSIAATVPLLIVVSARKTAGAAARGEIGLKINSTVVISTVANSVVTNLGSTGDNVDAGVWTYLIWPRLTNYLGGLALVGCSSGGLGGGRAGGAQGLGTAAVPNTTITSITITGKTGNAAVTVATDDLFVYALPIR